jgi:hypothetical protein
VREVVVDVSIATASICPVVLGLQLLDDVAVGLTEASKSVLSWPTVPSCNFCRLVSTLSLFMLISTPVQSAAACMAAV